MPPKKNARKGNSKDDDEASLQRYREKLQKKLEEQEKKDAEQDHKEQGGRSRTGMGRVGELEDERLQEDSDEDKNNNTKKKPFRKRKQTLDDEEEEDNDDDKEEDTEEDEEDEDEDDCSCFCCGGEGKCCCCCNAGDEYETHGKKWEVKQVIGWRLHCKTTDLQWLVQWDIDDSETWEPNRLAAGYQECIFCFLTARPRGAVTDVRQGPKIYEGE